MLIEAHDDLLRLYYHRMSVLATCWTGCSVERNMARRRMQRQALAKIDAKIDTAEQSAAAAKLRGQGQAQP